MDEYTPNTPIFPVKYGANRLNGLKVGALLCFQDGGRYHLGFLQNVIPEIISCQYVTDAFSSSNMVQIG